MQLSKSHTLQAVCCAQLLLLWQQPPVLALLLTGPHCPIPGTALQFPCSVSSTRSSVHYSVDSCFREDLSDSVMRVKLNVALKIVSVVI